ncbi:MAG TPA: glycosyltransferase family 39 protein [Candidatus Caccenecus avistercoris]|nr:glycosyltransferase family 39 protein [Candidatus Caccenecus avistercoris]
MNKFFSISYKVIIAILIVLFSYITLVSAFYGLDQNLSPIIVILGTIITFFLFKIIYKQIQKLFSKKIKIIAIIISILFFIGLLLVGLLLPISSVTDLSHIIEYVNRMFSLDSLTITGSYFSKYTNQVPLLIFAYFFTKIGSIFGCTNVVLMGTIFNALFMSIMAFFIYLTGKELKDEKTGLLALIFTVINPIFYLYSSYFYTDTLCMPFAVIGLYLAIKCIKTDSIKKKILFGILSGLIFFIGLKVRIVVVILLIAILALILINKEIKHKLKIYFALLIGLVVGLLGFKVAYSFFGINLNPNEAFPITHWLMMGLNEEHTGGYNGSDHDLTFNEKTYEEKKEANIEEIKTRLKELGPIGLIKLEGAKIARTWSSGNYGVYAKLNNTSDGVGIYEYLGGYGNTNIFLKYSLQILKTYISFMILLGLVTRFRKKSDTYHYEDIIYIALFGAILFYILWESAQRYSLSFLPWMIIPLGLIYERINKKEEDLSKKEKYNHIMKISSIALMLITTLLLTMNFYKYTLEEKTYEDVRILSYRGFSKIEIGENTVSQTFTTDNNFNQISINFENTNKEEKSTYLFRLYDSKTGEILAQKEFASSNVNGNYKFKFDDINPTAETTYEIEITKLEGESVLKIGTYDEGVYYKSYNNGSILTNDEEMTGSFIFRVDETHQRTYMSILSYSILSLGILAIEYVCLKDYIINKKATKDLRKTN